MKSKNHYKKEFEKFFEKHPNVRTLPWLITIVVPKYECRGERYVSETGENFERMHNGKLILDADFKDEEEFWESIMYDIPKISEKDAFYLFDENSLVIASNKNGIEIIDYEDEIFDMY